MKITDHLKKESIFLDVTIENKPNVLKYISDACAHNGIITDPELLYNGLLQREKTMSTGVGGGIGFPHTANPEIRYASVILLRLAKPIEFESLDHQPVDIILGLIFPESDPGIHVRMLARVSRLCQNPDFLSAIKQAENAERLIEQIKNIENGTESH
ncbi:MAG: PTS sugar transporter subunit IIA [Desulfobacteraceae bacterium]|nr:PTS sugar transporter subunit IIA [Desulfobacteraceae bacterium]